MWIHLRLYLYEQTYICFFMYLYMYVRGYILSEYALRSTLKPWRGGPKVRHMSYKYIKKTFDVLSENLFCLNPRETFSILSKYWSLQHEIGTLSKRHEPISLQIRPVSLKGSLLFLLNPSSAIANETIKEDSNCSFYLLERTAKSLWKKEFTNLKKKCRQ